jgi:hypothetical protein
MAAAPAMNIAEDAFRFFGELVSRDVISAYSGPVTDDLLSGFGLAMRAKLALDDTDGRIVRSMFSVLVEQVQNIIRYSSEVQFLPEETAAGNQVPAAGLRFGLVLVGRCANGAHFVSCSNLVDNENVVHLDDAISCLRGLDRKTLGAMIKQALRKETPSSSKGAGAGWLTVAREATGGFDYGFFPLQGTDKTYFTFRAYFQ